MSVQFPLCGAFCGFYEADFVYPCTQGFIALCRFPRRRLDEKVLDSVELHRAGLTIFFANNHLLNVFECGFWLRRKWVSVGNNESGLFIIPGLSQIH